MGGGHWDGAGGFICFGGIKGGGGCLAVGRWGRGGGDWLNGKEAGGAEGGGATRIWSGDGIGFDVGRLRCVRGNIREGA